LRAPFSSSPRSPQRLPPSAPDYDNLTPLIEIPPEPQVALAPALIIGLGSFGEAVLRQLAFTLRRYHVRENAGVQLLALQLQSSDSNPNPARHRLAELINAEALEPEEQLPLRLDRSATGSFSWYAHDDSAEGLSRSDGRLAVRQDLHQANPVLWAQIEKRMAEHGVSDVWIVGSCTEPASTGIVFELSHLIRLITRQFSQEVFVGWMFALPHADREEMHFSETIAFLREWARLQAEERRLYDFNEASDNSALHLHESAGKDDANILFLAEPPAELRREANGYMPDLVATSLFSLLQKDVWLDFKREVALTRRGLAGRAPIGALSSRAHFVPMRELQQAVRTRLAYDLIFDDRNGMFPRGALLAEEIDPDEVCAFLHRTGHPFLQQIAADYQNNRVSKGRHTTPLDLEHLFKLHLRQGLQSLVERPSPDNLRQCATFLAGLEEVIEGVEDSLEEEALKALQNALQEAQDQIEDWSRWRRRGRRYFKDRQKQAEQAWEDASSSALWQPLLKGSAREHVYASLVEGNADVRTVMRDYVRWSWVVEKGQLRLALDTLFPDWSVQEKTSWRHRGGEDDDAFTRLWQGLNHVIVALTRETKIWQQTRSEDIIIPVIPEEQEVLPLRLRYSTGKMQQDITYWSGRNPQWLKSVVRKGKQQSNSVSFLSGPTTLGLSLRCRFPIALSDLHLYQQELPRYIQSYTEPSHLHIFSPEQRALMLEQQALRRYRPHPDHPFWPLLPPHIILWLKDWERLQGFVGAWLGKLVRFEAETRAWHLYSLPGSPSASNPWLSLAVSEDHPLAALAAFMALSQRSPEESEWLGLGRELLAHATHLERYESLRDWMDEESSLEDRHWYILIEGLVATAEKRRNRPPTSSQSSRSSRSI